MGFINDDLFALYFRRSRYCSRRSKCGGSFAGSFLQFLLEALRPIFFYGCDCSCVWRSWTWRAVLQPPGTRNESCSRRGVLDAGLPSASCVVPVEQAPGASTLRRLLGSLDSRVSWNHGTSVRANSAGRTRPVSVAHIGVSITLPSRSASQTIISSSVIPGLCPSIANIVPIYPGA